MKSSKSKPPAAEAETVHIPEPKGWRKIWNKAQKERDPKKLIALIDELNRLLTEHEKKTLADDQLTSASKPPDFQSPIR